MYIFSISEKCMFLVFALPNLVKSSLGQTGISLSEMVIRCITYDFPHMISPLDPTLIKLLFANS